MHLKRYLAFVQDLLYSRQDLTVEDLFIEEIEPERIGLVEGRLRFWDLSLLRIVEQLEMRGAVLTKKRYVYHYQDSNDDVVFRYDNVAHHPEIATHPHHKHIRTSTNHQAVVAASPPSLPDVLSEVALFLYGSADPG